MCRVVFFFFFLLTTLFFETPDTKRILYNHVSIISHDIMGNRLVKKNIKIIAPVKRTTSEGVGRQRRFDIHRKCVRFPNSNSVVNVWRVNFGLVE